ncbi:hypothetical protein E2C01_018188 [Portunus trituberculatus]|uniref:Uncharacterized protein n=1 Tax=Portunus trituberculatus TaxID=210409 RepID=A0A5B7DVH9_PORTR|nr:hypothetical protein [Portunus trituberculatus]
MLELGGEILATPCTDEGGGGGGGGAKVGEEGPPSADGLVGELGVSKRNFKLHTREFRSWPIGGSSALLVPQLQFASTEYRRNLFNLPIIHQDGPKTSFIIFCMRGNMENFTKRTSPITAAQRDLLIDLVSKEKCL